MGTQGGHIGGMAYDMANQRLYILYSFAGGGNTPAIMRYDLCGFDGVPAC